MALREIRLQGDPILSKVCREVKEITPKIEILIEDMLETMYEAHGVGLAAPQVVILRRVVVIDVDDGMGPIVMINPTIVETDGEQVGDEGCLSVPGEFGLVKRPMHVKVRAQNRFGEWFEVEGDGLTARCFCHEIDHLEGILFTEKCERMLTEEEMSNGEY